MFTAEEMNLIHTQGGPPPKPLETPGVIHAYIGLGGKTILLGFTGDGITSGVFYAAVTIAEDEEQNAVLFDSMIHDYFYETSNIHSVLKELGMTTADFEGSSWILREFQQDELFRYKPEMLATLLACEYRRLIAKALLLTADRDAYIQTMNAAMHSCYDARKKITDYYKLAPVHAAAQEILHEYRCILLLNDIPLYKAYCNLSNAAGDLELTCHTMLRK